MLIDVSRGRVRRRSGDESARCDSPQRARVYVAAWVRPTPGGGRQERPDGQQLPGQPFCGGRVAPGLGPQYGLFASVTVVP